MDSREPTDILRDRREGQTARSADLGGRKRSTCEGLERDTAAPPHMRNEAAAQQTHQGPHQDPTLMEAYTALCGVEFAFGPVANVQHARMALERRMGLAHADLSGGRRLGDIDLQRELRNERLWQETVRNEQAREEAERFSRYGRGYADARPDLPGRSGYAQQADREYVGEPIARTTLGGGGANARQVGGDHYKQLAYEHWDLVAITGFDYFQGCATKYLSRARHKDSLIENYEKAMHYCQKGEEVDNSRDTMAAPRDNMHWLVMEFAVANKLTAQEQRAIELIAERSWGAAASIIRDMIGDASPVATAPGANAPR